MNKDLLEQLRYPIGKPDLPQTLTAEERNQRMDIISETPDKLKLLVNHLNNEQLDTPYRPEGWTVRQVVHHMVDSHINSYVRFRWALTEDKPLIKAYDEKAWAELPDAKFGDIAMSLNLLSYLHQRWVNLLKSMTSTDWQKVLQHPVSGALTLDQMLSLYAWHCTHHLAHISGLIGRNGWNGRI